MTNSAHQRLDMAGNGGPGVTGSETIVRDAVAKWRKGWNPPVTTAARLPSVSRVSRWLMPWIIIRGEENYASRFISLMCEKEPALKIAQQLVLEFYRILKTPNKSNLSSWFTRVTKTVQQNFGAWLRGWKLMLRLYVRQPAAAGVTVLSKVM